MITNQTTRAACRSADALGFKPQTSSDVGSVADAIAGPDGPKAMEDGSGTPSRQAALRNRCRSR